MNTERQPVTDTAAVANFAVTPRANTKRTEGNLAPLLNQNFQLSATPAGALSKPQTQDKCVASILTAAKSTGKRKKGADQRICGASSSAQLAATCLIPAQ